LAVVSGDDICSTKVQKTGDYSCFYAGTPNEYPSAPEVPYPGTGIKTTLAPGKARILLNVDHALSAGFMLGGSVGYAPGGAPDSGFAEGMHLELRGTSFFAAEALSEGGFQPFVGFGLGRGQVDVKVEGQVLNCERNALGTDVRDPGCADGSSDPPNTPTPVDIYAHYGAYFVQGGIGALYLGTSGVGLSAQLKLVATLPRFTFAMRPSVGAIVGF
jgi:hypothetical protein